MDLLVKDKKALAASGRAAAMGQIQAESSDRR